MKKLFSIIVTVYKNELNLPVTIPHYMSFASKLHEDIAVEFLFVNDGSPDNSYSILKEFQKKYPKKIKVINLTKNFGQVNAIMAGISQAKGDIIGYITSDMQDPIELFLEMLSAWREGYKLVIAKRESRAEKGISAFLANLVHFFVNKTIDTGFPKGGYDFFLLDREVAEKLMDIDEKNGQLTILLLWLGYKYKTIHYKRKERELGRSSWTLSKKIKLFIDIFTTNTYLPLRFISVLGVMASFFSFIFGLLLIIQWLTVDSEVRGWTSLILTQIFFSGLVLFSLGIIGEYLWRIFDYSKSRPNYIIDEIIDETDSSNS